MENVFSGTDHALTQISTTLVAVPTVSGIGRRKAVFVEPVFTELVTAVLQERSAPIIPQELMPTNVPATPLLSWSVILVQDATAMDSGMEASASTCVEPSRPIIQLHVDVFAMMDMAEPTPQLVPLAQLTAEPSTKLALHVQAIPD